MVFISFIWCFAILHSIDITDYNLKVGKRLREGKKSHHITDYNHYSDVDSRGNDWDSRGVD